jgi:translocation and assembly module TamA
MLLVSLLAYSRTARALVIALLWVPLMLSPMHATAQPANRLIAFTVLGIEGDVYRNVLAHLSVSKAVNNKQLLPLHEARQLHDQSIDEVKTALQAFGYYEPQVRNTFEIQQQWQLNISVVPGPHTKLRQVTIKLFGEGRDDKNLAILLQNSELRAGAPLMHEAYSDFKSALEKAAYGFGYLDAKYSSHSIIVYPREQVADVALHFDTGPMYFFGPVTIEQAALDPVFVARYIQVKEGDPFKSASLLKLQLRLNETNYFSSVRVDVQRERAVERHIPVAVITTPRKSSAYDFSAGFGTDTGARMGVLADYRQINRQGHRFRNQAELSRSHSTLVSQYVVPVDEVSSEYFDFSATVEHENVNDIDSVQYRLGISLNENRWGGRSRVALESVAENWSFGEQSNESARLLIPSLEFTRKQSNNTFFPTRGYSYTARVLGAADSVLSEVSFAQVQLFAKAVLPLTLSSRLLLRGDFFATATDDFDALPPSLRFYAGGAQSVRGYGYKDLSPQDSAGNLIGGQYLTTVSAEFDYLLKGNFGLAAFVDAGDATDNPFDSFKVGAGLGLRYRSPVGMLRLDVAHAFDDPDSDYRIHISFGIDL